MLSSGMVRSLYAFCVLAVTGWNTVYCVVCSPAVLCVLWCCVVLSLLSALEVCEVPGHSGDIPRVVYISVDGACGV